MKKFIFCLLALLLALQLSAFAEETEIVQKDLLPEATTQALSVNDFVTDTEYPYETVGYFLNDVAFLGEDLMEVSITFTGNYGSNEYFFSKCYIPVYNYETGKLLDIFYSDVELVRPFANSSRTTIKRVISTKNIDTDIYKIKVIMLESLTSLRPNCPVPYLANELVISKNDIAAKIPTATITSVLTNAPLSKEENSIMLGYNFNQIKLSDTAVSMGYTPDMIYTGIFTFDNLDLTHYVGLTCDFEIDLTDLDYPNIISVKPTKGKNAEIVVNPELLQETSFADGYIEYKKTADDDRNSKIKVPTTGLNVYKNLVYGSWTADVVPGGNVGDIAYRFVDTNGDAIYDTVFVDNIGIFVVGYVNTNSNRIFRDTTSEYAMSTFSAFSLTLDPDDEFINWSLTDKEGNPIEFSDIEIGSVAAVAYSCDGVYEYYDIVISNDTIEGQVAETYIEYDTMYYRINSETYTMLIPGMDGIIMPGDPVKATVYGNKIVNFTVDKGIRQGVVIATKAASDFDNTYQVRVLNQNGEILTLNMSDKVNGYTYDGYDFSKINPDDIMIYQLNHQGEIIAYDVEDAGTFQTNNLTDTKKLASGEGSYIADREKLDLYYLTDETVIVTTTNAKGSNEIDDYTLSSAEILEDSNLYTYSLIYNSDREIEFVVLYGITDNTPQPEPDVDPENPQPEVPLPDNNVLYGVVIATNVSSDFGETAYQVKILNTAGEIEILNLANRVNGEVYNGNNFTTDFAVDNILAYRLNSAKEIQAFYCAPYGNNNPDNLSDDAQVSFNTSGTYRESLKKLDGYFLTDKTVVILSENEVGFNDEYDYQISTIDFFDETENYDYTIVYDTNKEAKLVVLYQMKNVVKMNGYPLVITKAATVTVDGDYRTKYFGYMNGEEVEFVSSEDFDSGLLTVNDVAMISVNQKSEITAATILAKYSTTGYRVIDNASNAWDDAKYVTAGTEVTINFAPTLSGGATAAKLSSFFTAGATNAKNLKGFGAVGKAYRLLGNNLNLVSAFDYPSTFDGYDRYYGTNDTLISDYFIDSNIVAYIYNVRTGKIRLDSVMNMETETNTFDYYDVTQLENDDAVYVYNYDGETKLILIVDTMGDTL